MTPVLVDTHSHIQMDRFDDDRQAAIARAAEASVGYVVVCGDDPETCASALALARAHNGILPTVGYHPHEAAQIGEAELAQLRTWSEDPAVRAIGEIGLDYYREISPPEVQARVLDAQLDLAIERGLPVLVHSRAAEDAIAAHLSRYVEASPLRGSGREVGIMHCFGGTLEQAERYVEMGFLISLACTVTYPKNEEARRVASGISLEKLVIETDSPFLPPQEHRGKRNEPAFVSAAAHAIAGVRGISFDEVAAATTANALRLFAIDAEHRVVLA